METVRIDLPIFCSPTEAYGYFGADIEVTHCPKLGEPFPWPQTWLTKHKALFKSQENQVWGIKPWELQPSKTHITMFGIVCDSKAEAESLVRHIEQVGGILFDEH